MATLEDRVKSLEDRMNMEAGLAASRDGDLSALKTILNSHTGMMQGLQERQGEQLDTLKELSLIASGHSVILTHQTAVLKQQSDLLYQHTATLTEHTVWLQSLAAGVRTLEKEAGSLRQTTVEGFTAAAERFADLDGKIASIGDQLRQLLDRG